MTGWLAWTTGLLAAGVGLLALVATVRGRRIDDVQLLSSALLEVALIAQGVVGAVLLARGQREVDPLLFGGYLATSVVLMPVGVLWALGERTRWGTGVLAVAALATAVLVVRLVQVWSAGA
ncbi:hypothetical protein [Quadrisphaera sp. DSM 44207]|uniref:hypothetical protein n=1 Tax=Quadrisphaera sp. DSM 44207 TaxID=1881057 RepID=UPI0008924769|nr:hypothetical protein [Quadrisphaera sp. DSM 44207]SDQ39574.1 hypothetical protein SAMN05428996_1534 [Quadrisphaera sp. DSM 44207]